MLRAGCFYVSTIVSTCDAGKYTSDNTYFGDYRFVLARIPAHMYIIAKHSHQIRNQRPPPPPPPPPRFTQERSNDLCAACALAEIIFAQVYIPYYTVPQTQYIFGKKFIPIIMFCMGFDGAKLSACITPELHGRFLRNKRHNDRLSLHYFAKFLEDLIFHEHPEILLVLKGI